MKCPYCNSTAQKVRGDKIYKNRPDLHDRWFFSCQKCDAYVGTHENTSEPMGTMADRYLRSCRHGVHVFLDPLWEPNTKTRTIVYRRLAIDMQLKPEKCHVAMFDESQCIKAIKILKGYKREMFVKKGEDYES